MTRAKDFDLLNSPLEGTNLIEASAGTGKTYAVAGLFLRLILEKNLSANEILVVTFTEAATEELKERIRIRVHEAMEAFSTGEGKDEFLNSLIKKIDDHTNALASLKEAVRVFDETCIYTIHGFCRKMLYENAFESGGLFDTELVTDQEVLKREIVEDFWRMHFYGESPLFVNYALHNKTSPDSLLSLFGKKTMGLDLKIIPDLDITDSYDEEKKFKEAFNKLFRAWPSAKEEVEQILLDNRGLNRTRYGKIKIPGWIRGMDLFIASGGDNLILFDGFKKFCSSELERSVKKGHIAPDHLFFQLCEKLKKSSETLQDIFKNRLLGLKRNLFYYLQDELKQRKQKKNIQFFDDLLLNLYKALEGKGGEDLSGNIREKLKAALIDEFQDTDPIQYAIFKKIFGLQNSTLFLIGDPKQAIYGFRGADIFTYMDASTYAETRYTLKENWRSDPGLISAVNAVFENCEHPFLFDEIPFHPIAPPPEKTSYELLKTDDVAGSPLQMWFLDADKIAGSGKAINKSTAKDIISRAVASEISQLLAQGLENRTTLGERPLRQNDIAVLVRENAEAHIVQRALSELKIPSVLYTTDSLFSSHEALEMERVIAGIAQPDNENLLKVSLTTDMLGLKGEEIYNLAEDESRWEKWLIKFREYHRLWDERGFMRMFKSMAFNEKLPARLMTFPDGERRSTNLLHLSEVLHQASVNNRLGKTGLVKWLSEKRNTDVQGDEEHQLRLESDENAIKLVTIHRSKGLEFPIVFCPFAWGGSKSRNKTTPLMFHDKITRGLTLDLGSENMEQNRLYAEKEALAENLRVLYVALTRAKNRCYLVWGRINKADTSAPAYLFHQPDTTDSRDNIVNATGAGFKALSEKELYTELESVCDRAEGTIRLSEMPDEAGVGYSPLSDEQIEPVFREFKGKIDRQFRISSFSSIISSRPNSAELADHDGLGEPDDPYNQEKLAELVREEEPSGIFSFPKGAKAGTFMHDIFEHLDFDERDDSYKRKVIKTKLTEYGFETSWEETIYQMVNNVLSVPLTIDQQGLTLSHIPNQNRLNELGFYFPLKSISPNNLKRIYEKIPQTGSIIGFPEHMGSLNFSSVNGFMKGFMDMVFQFQDKFYLVDWKSNHLGNSVSDYNGAALLSAMMKNLYILQCHIYTAALNRYLQIRLPDYSYERHFGEVFYIFLRGVDTDAGPDFGIYRDRPSVEFIEEFCKGLIDK